MSDKSNVKLWRLSVAAVISLVLAAAYPGQVARAQEPPVGGAWSQLTNLPPTAVDNCLLMTDGTVLCHQYGGRNWYRLTPSNTGSYQAGTWALDSTMQSGYAPLYFASAVLRDGRVIVEGGEYDCSSGCHGTWQAQGSFYDPVSRTWTPVSPPAGWTRIGDAQSIVLSDGTFMLGGCCNGRDALFNPGTLNWTAVASTEADGNSDEEGLTLLPDNRVLTVDAWPAGSTLVEVFDPLSQLWTSAGHTPVDITANTGTSPSYEQGPGVLRPDGTVVYFGANASGAGHTTIFNSGTNQWTAGPDFPNGDGAADAPAALLPNGNVLVQASPGVFGTPSRWYEFTYAGGTFTQVSTPAYGFSPSSYLGQMLVLPSGQILQTELSNDVRLYTPTGSYNPSWAPTISSVSSSLVPGSTNTISGTQFNGLSQGGSYGDDWQNATNYPLVRITNIQSGHVFYAKTHDHSTMGVATGGTTVSTSFDVPMSIETGSSRIEVVANGIPSAPVTVSVGNLPGAFGKSSPASAAGGLGTSVTLGWAASSGATSYTYCVSTTNGNCASWQTAGTTNATVTGLSTGVTYYWQVRGMNAAGFTRADSGTWWAFTVASASPGAFGKASLANGSVGASTSVTLSWNTSSNATSYVYCVSLTGGSCSNWTDAGTATSTSVSGLSAGTTYYWQVRAVNGLGFTPADSGTWWSFGVAAGPGPLTKIGPTSGTSGPSTSVTLSWSTSSNAASYLYCVSLTSGACSGWTSAGTATSATVNGLSTGTTYYWQVRGVNAQGVTPADSGTWWSFSVSASSPGPLSKIGPTSGTTGLGTSVGLSWGASSNATSYVYCVSLTSGTCGGWTTTGTGTSATVSGLSTGTTYYWQVRGVNVTGVTPANSGTWWSFVTQ